MGARGVTVAGLSAAIEVEYQAVAKVLKGGSKSMSAENCAKAAKYMRVSIYWLILGEGGMDDVSDIKDDWPFPGVDKSEYEKLSPSDRAMVQVTAAEAMKDILAKNRKRQGAPLSPLQSIA